MLFEMILALLIGIIFGTLTGLIPGIHINLISGLLISLSSFIFLNPIYATIFITSMAITHTFVDFIPSIFLGCPDTDTELSILPGHQLLKNRKGYEAIYLSNLGSLIALPLTILILIPSIFFIKNFYPLIQNLIPYFLILISIILILTEKRKFSALIIFALTGFLGFSITQLQINQPLLPLLTGLFGLSNIVLSIKNKTQIPKQKITKPKIKIKKPIIGAIFASPICGFLPGIGAGQAALMGNIITKLSQKQFLVLLGITNTLVMSLSFISLFFLNKTRTGAVYAIKELTTTLELHYFIVIIFVIFISGIISFFITDKLAKYFSPKLNKINYNHLSYFTIIILFLIVLIISGPKGILILIISMLTGIYSIEQKVRRTNMMGCLVIPTIIWYLF